MKELSEYAPTKRSAIRTLYAAFQILKENGGEMRRKDLLAEIEKRVAFEEWETERYDSNNQFKWLTVFLFYTIDSLKAGWLGKNKGIWFLTPEGEKAIELGPVGLFETANKAYRQWDSTRENKTTGNNLDAAASIESSEIQKEGIDIGSEQVQKATIDELEAQANEAIGSFIDQLKEFKFQNLSATLIKAMGYHIDFEAPPGKDGGIDIIAFKDPLGYEKPYLKVQVKHYKLNSKVDVKEVRSLKGVLHQGEDIGIFITSGYYTKDAEVFARETNPHIKLIDRDAFIDLWKQYYEGMSEEEKLKMPLHPIYFLGE